MALNPFGGLKYWKETLGMMKDIAVDSVKDVGNLLVGNGAKRRSISDYVKKTSEEIKAKDNLPDDPPIGMNAMIMLGAVFLLLLLGRR